MKINFYINQKVLFGQTICICGSLPELGQWDENKAIEMSNSGITDWAYTLESENNPVDFEYYYLIKENNTVVAKEWGNPRKIGLNNGKTFFMNDCWYDAPKQHFLYSSAFTDSFFAPGVIEKSPEYYNESVLLTTRCPYVEKEQELVILGESDLLGYWQPENALHMQQTSYGQWSIMFDASEIKNPLQYKFAIYDTITDTIIHWEEGSNKTLFPFNQGENSVQIVNFDYQHACLNWKTSGIAIPVFSLRTKKSFGIGEFSDLKMMTDWAKATGMKIIQILPVNDTTITHTWTDSYPYNAISIYALHPIYLGLNEFPLDNSALFKEYKEKAAALNSLKSVDYEKVHQLKSAYIVDLYKERGDKTLQSNEFKKFFKKNESWIFPYACFCYFRDEYKTANYEAWNQYSKYNQKALSELIEKDNAMKQDVYLTYFTQYLLHVQLLEVKKYAHKNEVILKGDIPIGISHDSVGAWVEPHLFNLDTQTGAPPDDFSAYGQNWGFPTYNWDEMSKNNYQWWIKRFCKMSDYFDAYRIDHILGFFRIWEIPLHSVQGLLGYFSPALPFTIEELGSRGIVFDEERMTQPYIHEHFLSHIFENNTQEAIKEYLIPTGENRYKLKDICNTQVKIKALFAGKNDDKSNNLRNGLYSLCNEVLFIRDKREPNKFHPRIMAHTSFSFADLNDSEKAAFHELYVHFFFQRHNQFWREQAMKKLPVLISSTDMLVCGEDLGMIPDCVPPVMDELQILRLEIQRMPKDINQKFENLNFIPYLSVCTTSTHDMSPIRAWWEEDKHVTQQYFNDVLWKQGTAPQECTPELCWQIVMNHLNSPAMLSIIPLQDWLSIDKWLRRENPDEERINNPAIAQFYWQYRMHLTLEELLEAEDFNNKIREMLKESNRT